MKLWRLISFVMLSSACSSVRSTYLQNGYNVQAANPVKRIAVATWAPATTSGLADVVGRVATDLIKLRKNYLVHATAPLKQAWSEQCKEHIDGVFAVRVLESSVQSSEVYLQVVAELYRCVDGALVWRADADASSSADNADLAQLTATYVQGVGPAAKDYAAPAFVLLQQIIAKLPDPLLTDADIEEKIELGRFDPRRASALALRAKTL